MADARRETARLDQPRERVGRRLPTLGGGFDSDAFGVFAEKFARFMGTAKFLVWMTVFVVVWVLWNIIGIFGLNFDPYPFILLNLFFSTQASYAAPLILLAQNRQDDRDRVALEQDRARDERNLADTEYLTREVASLRIAMRDMATRDFLRSELRDLIDELGQARAEPCPYCGGHPQEPKAAGAKKPKHKAKHHEPKVKATRPSPPDTIADGARARLAESSARTEPPTGATAARPAGAADGTAEAQRPDVGGPSTPDPCLAPDQVATPDPDAVAAPGDHSDAR